MHDPQVEPTAEPGLGGKVPTIKVVYILGFGRSGSTIIGDILGELPGWFHTGELCGLWLMLKSRTRSCSCGASVRDCAFWSQVVVSGWGDLDPDTVRSWYRRVLRFRHTNRFLRADAAHLFAQEPLGQYLKLTRALYESISRVADAPVIVDSSKRPHHAALLHSLPGIEPYFVHLVRDARAVAYSKGKEESRIRGTLPSGSAASARNWVILNLASDMVRRKFPTRSTLIHYEDFAARPRETLSSILDLVREEAILSPFIDDTTVRLGHRHTLKGSPNRFTTGLVSIRKDDAWISRLPARRAALVTALTSPLLLRYGYPLRYRDGRR